MISAARQIEAAYQQLGYTLGWRLLTCPEANIRTASVALITINPGGGEFIPAKAAVEEGSAYVVESWKGCAPGREKLQLQVQRMYQLLNVVPSEVLSGYLVPFRSPDWKRLARKSESLTLGLELWRGILAMTKLNLVVAFGKEIAPHVSCLLSADLVGKVTASWGKETIDVYRFGEAGKLVVLPHLSRFSLFCRTGSEAAFLSALEGLPTAEKQTRVQPTQDIIRLLAPNNPKIGLSRFRFECYRDGMTFAEYEQAVRSKLGDREAKKCRADIRWDLERNLIRLE